ncbi:sodium/potassium-transporting ATPase subunit beta-2 isoform X1 [Aquila chrysaetos chrysaetos]|uniref:sodium/potassium-transporting ATPase subunit beta-2 isoform X1 n=1 Tax=Aquila chrysaetos chrysaetos TaxID=223781 RepID=UPI001176BD33|nr:sodium/potassium-transporting ATPase subunit beta-2 isoform X1 [Aquila chrysaetos chrysaetos]
MGDLIIPSVRGPLARGAPCTRVCTRDALHKGPQMGPRGGECWRGVVVQWAASPPPVWPSHEGSRGLARGSLRGTLHWGALHGGGRVMGGFPPQHPLARGLARGPPVACCRAVACCTAVAHCTAVTCEACKPSVILVQGGAVRCAVLVHGPSVLVCPSCQACARLVRARCVPRVLLLHAACLCDRCASSTRSMGGGWEWRARGAQALVRGVSSCAGMMIRPRTEGLDVTFNVTQSQTWRHYVRALHQFLERECTGRGLGQTEVALEWTGLYWEGPVHTGRALVHTGRHWAALGGPKSILGGTGRACVHTGRAQILTGRTLVHTG